MNWLLKITEGPAKGAEIALVSGTRVKIGRGEACDVVLSDQSLAETAFELDVSDAAVTMLTPDGRTSMLKPFEAHGFGTSAFAIGPADGPWDPIVAAPPDEPPASEEAPAEENSEKKEETSAPAEEVEPPAKEQEPTAPVEEKQKGKGIGCLLGSLFFLLLLAFLVWWLWPRYKEPALRMWRSWRADAPCSGKPAPAAEQKVPLGLMAQQYGLELVEKEGERPLLKGNLRRRTERMALRALALASDPECAFDLTDDESLRTAADELLFVVTEGAIKATAASNRVVTLAGYAPNPQALEMAIRALNADVPGIDRLVTTSITVGGTAPKDVASSSFVRGNDDGVDNASAPDAAPAKLTLPIAGILAVPYPCVVMNDGRRLLEGAPIGSATIVKIEVDRIVLADGGATFEWRP